MSTDLDIFQQGGAVATRNRRDDGFTSNVGGSTITSKSIVIINNKLRLMVNGKEISKSDQGFIDVVIVNAAHAVNRMFYGEQFDPKAQKRTPPKCWSHDSQTPDPQSREKQAEKCSDCPQNIAGSGLGKTKACRFHRYIAVVLADDLQGDIYRVKLSATSVFGEGNNDRRPFHEYRDYLVANGEGLGSVVSRMIVGEDTSNLGFKAVARLSDAEFDVCRSRTQEEEAVRAITLSVAVDRDDNGEEFAPAPKANPRPATRQPIIEEVEEAEETEEEFIPEPVKRSSAEAKPAPTPPAPPPAKADLGDISLDDLVSDWT
jgi:hypothetical protein